MLRVQSWRLQTQTPATKGLFWAWSGLGMDGRTARPQFVYVCRAQQRCPVVGDRGLDGNACLEHGSAHGGKGGVTDRKRRDWG